MSSKKIRNKFSYIVSSLVLSALLGCSSGVYDEYYSGRSNSVPYSIPAQQPVRPYSSYQQQPQQYQNPYQNPQQPYYYGAPNSRSYYNPYDFQQPYGRNPYSDYEQYYVPPDQYYNNEEPVGKGSTVFSGKS